MREVDHSTHKALCFPRNGARQDGDGDGIHHGGAFTIAIQWEFKDFVITDEVPDICDDSRDTREGWTPLTDKKGYEYLVSHARTHAHTPLAEIGLSSTHSTVTFSGITCFPVSTMDTFTEPPDSDTV